MALKWLIVPVVVYGAFVALVYVAQRLLQYFQSVGERPRRRCSFGHTIRSFETRARAINSLATSPALIVLPRPTSSARSVTGRRRQKVMRFVT
jgi:hypothetical protein